MKRMTLNEWKKMHNKLNHQLDVIKADPSGSVWYFTPRYLSDVCGLWAADGSIVDRLVIVPFDQLLNSAPIEALYGPEPMKTPPLSTKDRLEVWFASPITEIWIGTRRIK